MTLQALVPLRLPLFLLPLLLMLLLLAGTGSASDANRTAAAASTTTTTAATTAATTTAAGAGVGVGASAAAEAASPAQAGGMGQGKKEEQLLIAGDAGMGEILRGESAWTQQPTALPPPHGPLGPCESAIEMIIFPVSSKQALPRDVLCCASLSCALACCFAVRLWWVGAGLRIV